MSSIRWCRLSEAIDHDVLPQPYVVKPVADGSSVGVHIVDKGNNSLHSMVDDEGFDPESQMMVERYVPGRELTCAVMGNVALGVTEVVSAVGFYDYTAKYKPGGSEHILPADLTDMVYHRVQKYALAAHTEPWLQGRQPFRLPLQRHRRYGRRTDLHGNQHPARYDGHIAGAGDGRSCRP